MLGETARPSPFLRTLAFRPGAALKHELALRRQHAPCGARFAVRGGHVPWTIIGMIDEPDAFTITAWERDLRARADMRSGTSRVPASSRHVMPNRDAQLGCVAGPLRLITRATWLIYQLNQPMGGA